MPGSRAALRTIGIFVGGVIAFSSVALWLELAAGYPLHASHVPGTNRSVEDALWHVGTAFVLALPARRLWLAVVGPALALGIDVDHVFGAVLPTVLDRQAHDLFFLILIGLLLYYLEGRSAALSSAGAILAHVAVDGGRFPFFAPVSVATYPLALWESVVLLTLGAGLFFLSVKHLRDLRAPTNGLALVAVVAGVSIALAAVPAVAMFNGA